MHTDTDRIEKSILLRAPQARVWRALTDAAEFGTWFRLALEGPFTVGQPISARITHPGYEHVTLELLVEAIEPEHRFAYRWHPYSVDPAINYAAEPTTLVEFTLASAPGGTQLTVVESGFDQVPAERRELAFRMNTQGWQGQIVNIERYLASVL